MRCNIYMYNRFVTALSCLCFTSEKASLSLVFSSCYFVASVLTDCSTHCAGRQAPKTYTDIYFEQELSILKNSLLFQTHMKKLCRISIPEKSINSCICATQVGVALSYDSETCNIRQLQSRSTYIRVCTTGSESCGVIQGLAFYQARAIKSHGQW